jgi:hypothetical protein
LVEIVDVPDDEHVRLRRDDGIELIIALEEIREAVLAVDWDLIGKRRQ